MGVACGATGVGAAASATGAGAGGDIGAAAGVDWVEGPAVGAEGDAACCSTGAGAGGGLWATGAGGSLTCKSAGHFASGFVRTNPAPRNPVSTFA